MELLLLFYEIMYNLFPIALVCLSNNAKELEENLLNNIGNTFCLKKFRKDSDKKNYQKPRCKLYKLGKVK